MAKKKDAEDHALDNLFGFAKRGARSASTENFPTGHFDLDFAIHFGMLPGGIDLSTLDGYDSKKTLGLPAGRCVELFGGPGSGKSSLAYRVVGYAQKMGYECLWIDTEHSFSDALAEKINGVDIDKLLYSELFDRENPEKNFNAEDVLDMIIQAVENGVKVVVLDSVANMIPKERMEKESEKILVARLARCMSENFPKVAHYVAKNNAILILVNHIREKVGVRFGDTEDSPGGFALKHGMSLRIKLTGRKSAESLILIDDEESENGKKVVGRYSGATLKKNRMGKPLLDANGKAITIDLPIYYEPYFPTMSEMLFGFARKEQLITVRKGEFKWGDIRVDGRKNMIDYIEENSLVDALGYEVHQLAKTNKLLLPPEIASVTFKAPKKPKSAEAVEEEKNDKAAEKLGLNLKTKRKKNAEKSTDEEQAT